MFSLEGKTIILTGSTGYFGRSFSKILLKHGAKLILLGRSEKLNILDEELKDYITPSSGVEYHDINLYSSAKLEKVILDICDRHETIDVVINNAFDFSIKTGFNDASGTLLNMSKEQWFTSMESGIYWASVMSKLVLSKMINQGHGNIINISSMYGIVSPDPNLYVGTQNFNPPSYSVSKSALIALTKYIASFYGKYGVRSNALCPGAFPNTKFKGNNTPDQKILKKLEDKTALGRYGVLEDLSGPIVFLSSDASSYMTGQTLIIDGGWTIT